MFYAPPRKDFVLSISKGIQSLTSQSRRAKESYTVIHSENSKVRDIDVTNMKKNTKLLENPQNRLEFSDSDSSMAAAEEYQYDVIEDIPLEEMAKEIRDMSGMLDGVQAHLSAGGFGKAAKSPRNPEDIMGSKGKPGIRENSNGFSDSDSSLTGAQEYQHDVIEDIPIEDMANEMRGMSGMLDSVQARLSAGGFGKAAKPPRNPEDIMGPKGKPVIRENCLGFGDGNDSQSERSNLSSSETTEELEQNELEEGKEIPFKEIAEEIRAMNGKLDRIQARLPVDVFEDIAKLASSVEEEMGLEPEDTRWLILNGSQDPTIRALQVNSRRIRCQLAELVRCSELGAASLMAMNRQCIRHSKHLKAYRKQYESVHSYHLAHQLEAGKCLMRFRHCQEVFCTWRELNQMGNRAKEAYNKIMEATQSRGLFVDLRKQALRDIAQVHTECISSSCVLTSRVEDMGRTMGFASMRVSKTEPQLWKDYTGPPVVVKTTHWQGRYTQTVRFARGELLTIPVVVPPTADTWYGRMQANLLRIHTPKTKDAVEKKKSTKATVARAF